MISRKRILDKFFLMCLFALGAVFFPALVAGYTDTPPGMGSVGLFAGLGIVCWLAGLIIEILIVVYMYKDAEKRGESGVLWAIIGFFLGIIGLIVWLIVRKDKPVLGPGGVPPGQMGYQQPPPPGYGYQQPPQGYSYQQPPPPGHGQPPSQGSS